MNMVTDHILLAICWFLYCILHSVLAYPLVKEYMYARFGLSDNHYLRAYNIFAGISLIAVVFYHFSVDSFLLFQHDIVKWVVSPVLFSVGIAIMVTCIVNYFGQLSGLGKAKSGLIITGLHRHVRHPLYMGTFIMLIGAFLFKPSISNAIAVLIIISYTIWAIKLEEQKLITRFGDEYIQYQEKVPSFIPRIESIHQNSNK